MANLTKAERHNRILNQIVTQYEEHQKGFPPYELYNRFLEIATEKLCITKNEAIKKYGKYTVKQWESLLQLGWNKN